MKRRTYILTVLAVILTPLYWTIGPPIYFAREITAKIVDEDTGQPIEGAVVVAEWVLYAGGHGGRINTIETQTNADGVYHMAAWGPRIRTPWARLINRDPTMTFFKGGYYPDGGGNHRESRDIIRTSDYDGKILKLKKFDGNFEKLSRALSTYDAGDSRCWWDCPLYVLALDAESKRLEKIVPRGMVFSFPQKLENLAEFERYYFIGHK